MSIFKPKTPKGTSQSEIIKAQESAAQRERDRLAQEENIKKADADKKAITDLQETESRRRAFAGQLAGEEDEEQRRKFLKGA